MIPDILYPALTGGIAVFCLLIFGIPILLVRYHPSLDDKDVELINTMAVSFVVLLLLVRSAVDLLLIFWDKTGNFSQALFWIAALTIAGLVSMGIMVLYTKLTGIKVNPMLGGLAGGSFITIWWITSDLALSFIILYAGFILLFAIFIYQKKTGISLDLSSYNSVNSLRFGIYLTFLLIIGAPLLILMVTNSPPFALLMLGIVAFFCYGRLFPVFSQSPEDDMADIQEEVVFINLPYDKAFEVCKKAIGLFQNPDWTEIVTSDPKSGIISIQVYTVTNLLTKCATRLTLSLEKTEDSRTRVSISGVTSDPVIALPRNPSGMNRIYVDRMVTYIRKLSFRMDT
jgi:hypothetical protein